MGFKDISNKIKQDFIRGFRREMYRNLVFKGGGVRGIAYIGALEALEEINVLKNIDRVAGTSAGAVAATLVSFRKNTGNTLDIFNTLDIQKVTQRVAKGKVKNIILAKNTGNYSRLFENFGWYSSEYFHKWLQSIIANQCRGNPEATFTDFRKMGYRDLYIVASNISRHRAEVFSANTTPDVAVADAVRMSISIPLFFEALRFDGKKIGAGDYYVDGGLFNNYPLHIFDQPEYAKQSHFYRNGVNLETLGMFLYPSKLFDAEKADDPKHLWEFIDLTVRSLYEAHQVSDLAENVADKQRTIEISDCGISATHFNLAPESEEYHQLITAGREAVEKFFGIEK
ncbi:MAG: patatin-like phospholipase family protein [Anaerolineaceae bacterium]|nr:patatin-like phospholipase family protein [Anaerolineaceae bacterium]